jgi:cell division protein ZapA (FtsZ GTPase activity inhibitor)
MALGISVNIAGRTYRLQVETEEEEEMIRKAVAEINSRVKEFADNYSFKDHQDLLAMVSLDITTKLLSKETMTSAQKEEIVEGLSEINNIFRS